MNACLYAALLGAVACGAAQAQALLDPTQPPAQMAPADAAGALEPSRPVLQSVLIARQPGGRRVAVIDGQTVRVGEQFKGARLTSVSDNQAVLLRGADRLVLRLYPGAEPAPGAPAPRSPSPR